MKSEARLNDSDWHFGCAGATYSAAEALFDAVNGQTVSATSVASQRLKQSTSHNSSLILTEIIRLDTYLHTYEITYIHKDAHTEGERGQA